MVGIQGVSWNERRQYASRLFESQRYRAASWVLKDLVAAAPRNLDLRMLLARSYYYTAQLSLAEAELRQVLRAEPAHPSAHLALARVLERQHRCSEAAPHMRAADTMTARDLLALRHPHNSSPRLAG
ncbi:tetratricopeptide repeat protein [Streptomyces sp. NRRL S-1824]|uniref:tetratricopeptide repeat protein n=1 Tax=Streptomyces sp. NRRL S-1824 TaxID=1463889 RepID=UPI00068A22EC|nr:tetratricopeptide repeat protein [Streptomyces sp. NRRL S-1824]